MRFVIHWDMKEERAKFKPAFDKTTVKIETNQKQLEPRTASINSCTT